MIRKLLGREEVGAAVVLALSGAVVVLVSRGDGPLSAGRFVSGVLSNPIPRGAAGDLPPALPPDASGPPREAVGVTGA